MSEISYIQVFTVAGLWTLFFIQHSLMARIWFQERFGKKYYRLVYNTISILLFLPALLYPSMFPGKRILPESSFLQYSGLTFAAFGVILGRKSLKLYDMGLFMGFRQPSGVEEKEALKTTGLLSRIRHPLYASSILLIIGYFLFLPHVFILESCILLLAYTLIGMRLEERKLIRLYGDRYREYMDKVPALIPRFSRR